MMEESSELETFVLGMIYVAGLDFNKKSPMHRKKIPVLGILSSFSQRAYELGWDWNVAGISGLV